MASKGKNLRSISDFDSFDESGLLTETWCSGIEKLKASCIDEQDLTEVHEISSNLEEDDLWAWFMDIPSQWVRRAKNDLQRWYRWLEVALKDSGEGEDSQSAGSGVLKLVASFVLKEKHSEVKIFVDSEWMMAWLAYPAMEAWKERYWKTSDKNSWGRSGMKCGDSFITG